MVSESIKNNAESGDASAQYELGIAYCLGHDCTVDFEEAAKWFKKAVEQDYIPAKRELGIMYLSGDGVKADPDKAFELLKSVADTLEPNAMYHLALMYEKGLGTEKDLYQAIKLLAYAASVDYPGADMDAERINDIITNERIAYLRARPLLKLEVSDVDVMAACCKPMLEAMINEDIVMMDTYGGPQLVGEDEEGNDLVLDSCPYCGKPLMRVPKNKKY